MNITLTSDITVELVQAMGGDVEIVRAARVSTLGGEGFDPSRETPAHIMGLILYLMKHRHGSPFEHGAMTFRVHAPIFVWREWHRHRIGFSYNEESARYKQLEPVFWVPRRDRPMIPVEGWKPGRPKFLTLDVGMNRPDIADHERKLIADQWYETIVASKRRAYEAAYRFYLAEIEEGVSMEVARSVLPVAIYSSCYVTCNPRSLMAFLSLRTHDEAATHVSYPQAEIEEAARACERIFQAGWPTTYWAFRECGRVAP